MAVGFDNRSIYHHLLVGLAFDEYKPVGGGVATGEISYDRASPHHTATLNGATIIWGAVASGFPYLAFTAATPDYVDSPVAADLDFTTENFSLLAWINITALADMCIMCRGVNNLAGGGGYSLIVDNTGRLGFVTCQGAPVQNSVSYTDITAGDWFLVGGTRDDAVGITYINGLDRTDAPDTHIDPATQNEPLHIGARQSGTGPVTRDIPFNGYIAYPRIWGDRALSRIEMKSIWDYERHWFDV